MPFPEGYSVGGCLDRSDVMFTWDSGLQLRQHAVCLHKDSLVETRWLAVDMIDRTARTTLQCRCVFMDVMTAGVTASVGVNIYICGLISVVVDFTHDQPIDSRVGLSKDQREILSLKSKQSWLIWRIQLRQIGGLFNRKLKRIVWHWRE